MMSESHPLFLPQCLSSPVYPVWQAAERLCLVGIQSPPRRWTVSQNVSDGRGKNRTVEQEAQITLCLCEHASERVLCFCAKKKRKKYKILTCVLITLHPLQPASFHSSLHSLCHHKNMLTAKENRFKHFRYRITSQKCDKIWSVVQSDPPLCCAQYSVRTAAVHLQHSNTARQLEVRFVSFSFTSHIALMQLFLKLENWRLSPGVNAN